MFYGLSSLLPLLILGGLVYLIVRAMRNRRADAAPGDAGSARRFFVYVGLYVAFFVSAVGLSGLLGQVLSTAAARSDSDIATTLALVIVGVPVFAALARWTWRRLVADPADRASTGWSLYLNAALITSVALVATSLAALLSGFVDGSGYTGELLAMVLVWTAGWVGHWMAWRLVPPERGPNVHLIGGSAIGLGMLAVGIALALTHAGEMIVDGLSDVVSRGRSDDLGIAVVVAGVGLLVWAWHWLRHARSGDRTTLWLAYVLLYGVLGGLAAAVTGAGRALFLVLEWFAGDPESVAALDHFRQLSPALAAAAVGTIGWQYHRVVIGPRDARERTDVDRTYDAIVSATALATVAAAVVILVLSVFELAAPADVVVGEPGSDILLAAVTLFVVGGPLWWHTWGRMQRYASAGEAEVVSAPRRIYLSSAIGIGGLVAFGALISLLVVVFEAWLDERTGSLIEPLSWPVALFLTAGAIAVYHTAVMLGERHQYRTEPPRDVLLVWAGNGAADELAAATRTTVRVLHRSDIVGHPDVATIADAIEHARGSHLVVVAGADEVTVVPYD